MRLRSIGTALLVLVALWPATGRGHCVWTRASLEALSADGRTAVLRVAENDTEGGTAGYWLELVRLGQDGHQPLAGKQPALKGRDFILPYHPSHGAGGAPHTKAEQARAKRKHAAFLRRARRKHGVLPLGDRLFRRGTDGVFERGESRIRVRYRCGKEPVTTLHIGTRTHELRAPKPGRLMVVRTIAATDSDGVLVLQLEQASALPAAEPAACPPRPFVCDNNPVRFHRVTLGGK